MLGLLVVGFARPTAEVQVPRERATVMVAIDVSASMEADDVAPTRIEAAKQAAGAFVDRLPEQFNVGVVAFSGTSSVVVAPSEDHARARTAIDGLRLGPGTAIGEAVFSALQGIAGVDSGAPAGDGDGEPVPARIVLMSDGTNTGGRSLADAAAAATEAGVPVSTIAYGTPEGTVTIDGQTQAVPADADSLRGLAEDTGGQAYTAASGEELGDVYADIGSSIGTRTERQEISAWFIGAGLLAAAAAAAASLAWFSRLP